MYNALTGLGGSGQVNQTVAANANVALLSATAATALFVVGPIFDRVGARVCLLLGGWTYPLYSGSLLAPTTLRLACAVHVAAVFLNKRVLLYQQNVVNRMTFNIRTGSLNGALYWFAQMVGGLVIGSILDMPRCNRRRRARVAWCFLFTTGMGIWGGGYAFQKWFDHRMAMGFKQTIIDYTDSVSVGPMFLYIFYGCYDAFWQSFCYWLVGASSNSPAVTAVLVGAYKTFQSIGGAMAWRINALGHPAMTQFAIDRGICMGSLVFAIPAVLTVTMTSDS